MIAIKRELDASIEPGHQWIVIDDTDEGRALATVLAGHAPLRKRGRQILVPHDARVDMHIVNLIDQLAHIRYQAPGLIQMTLEEPVS